MRKWLKVEDNLDSLETMLGHHFAGVGQFAFDCQFCKAQGYRMEAHYTVTYDSEALDPPNHIQKVELCLTCSKPAISTVGITPRNKTPLD